MNVWVYHRDRLSRIVQLAVISILCPSTFFASGLTSGHYNFQVRYAPLCLYGNYPVTVNNMTTGCLLRVDVDPTGALSGILDIRTIPGVATGTFTSQNNVVSLHLHAIGGDPLNTESDIDAQLSGSSQFIGTATVGDQSGPATMDVSTAGPLLVTFDFDITVDPQGPVIGAGTASACEIQLPVNVTGTNDPSNCVLDIVGANLPSFTWHGSGLPTQTGFTAEWSANGFGAIASGTELAIAAATPTPTPGPCVFGQGYWKNHQQWPVNQLQLGNRTYSRQELQTILRQPPRGNALVQLAQQEITAKLNIANAANGACIVQTLSEVDASIGNGIIPPVGDGYLPPTPYVRILGVYNAGGLCAPRCDVTPPPTPRPTARPRPTAAPRPGH